MSMSMSMSMNKREATKCLRRELIPWEGNQLINVFQLKLLPYRMLLELFSRITREWHQGDGDLFFILANLILLQDVSTQQLMNYSLFFKKWWQYLIETLSPIIQYHPFDLNLKLGVNHFIESWKHRRQNSHQLFFFSSRIVMQF